jgi:enamine deaminase RidA (YjgF/YER057c/UK114 family)
MRQNISGNSPYEPIIGFSRAVRVGNQVFVSGTGPVGADDADAATQTKHILAAAATILERAGSSLEHVVRTRLFLANTEEWEAIGRAHGEVFGRILPASSMVGARLLNPKWHVEIELDAIIPDGKND